MIDSSIIQKKVCTEKGLRPKRTQAKKIVGVVSLRSWKHYFGGNSFQMYDGTHFMEEEFVRTILADKVRELLG